MKSSENRGYSVGRCTDVGKIRAVNEDNMGDLPTKDGHVLIVADGMGGYRGGAIASRLVIETIEEYFLDSLLSSPQQAMRQAISLANERIHMRGQLDEELSRMGSTCVLAVVKKNELFISHVGDSRIYLLREGGELQRITRDHTVVQHFVDVGLLSEDEAEDHPDSHILSRALGPRANVEPDVRETALKLFKGDRVMLCSDGVTKMISELEMNAILKLKKSAQSIAERLVDEANLNGGEDNSTVVVFEFDSYTPSKEELARSSFDSEIDPFDETATSSALIQAIEKAKERAGLDSKLPSDSLPEEHELSSPTKEKE